MWIGLALATMALGTDASVVSAQFTVGLEATALRYSAGPAGVAEGEHRTFRFYRPSRLRASIEGAIGTIHWYLGGSTQDVLFAIEGDEFLVGYKGRMTIRAVDAGLFVPLLRQPGGATLRVAAGPQVVFWNLNVADGARTRLAVSVRPEVQVPMTARLSLMAHVEGAYQPKSVFRDDEVPPGFDNPSPAWWGMGLGLRYGSRP